jgi:hypothetical protein
MHSGFKHCTVPPAKFSIVLLDLPVDACEYEKKCAADPKESKIVQRSATQTEIFA